MPIDESLPFRPVRIAVLTVSDSRSAADDKSGDKLADLLTAAGHILAERAISGDADVKNYADYLYEHAGGAILAWVMEGARLIHSTLRTWQDWEAGKARMHPGLWELFILKTRA